MSTPPPMTVQIKLVGGQAIADPASVSVSQAETYLAFSLLIPGLRFADTGPIQVPPAYAGSFLGPWKISANNASLLDLNNLAGEVPYTVTVVGASGTPYTLAISPPPTIVNSGPQ